MSAAMLSASTQTHHHSPPAVLPFSSTSGVVAHGSQAAPAPAGATPAPAGASGAASAASAVIGPLPAPKTITMTLVPDWNQQELRSPLRPACVKIVLGPANTTPEKALWCFEFNVYAMDQLTGPAKKADDEVISKGSRALLWFGGKPYPKYQHAVVLKGCKMSTTDELKTLSVVIRPYSEEKDPNALLYVRKKPGGVKGNGIGYLKLVQGHHYYINITFAAGSSIAQLVGLHSWRPLVYLVSKRPGREDSDFITGSRQFTNFVTNWAQGVEVNPDDREQKGALDALVQDQTDEEVGKVQSANARPQSQAPPVFYETLDPTTALQPRSVFPNALTQQQLQQMAYEQQQRDKYDRPTVS
jgi:hypothetical protein